MRTRIATFMVLTAVTGSLLASSAGSRFKDVWAQVASDPYEVLPTQHVSISSFFHYLTNKLSESATRTLNDNSDVLPHFQKLVHPVGICFAGTWNITQENPYTGYFENGRKGHIIVRASSAMGEAEAGNVRSFGFAGKIYPTDDAQDAEKYTTANFFTVDDLGGTLNTHFTDGEFTNEPPVSTRLAGLSTGLFIAMTFKRIDSNAGIRPLYPIAELGLDDPSQAKAPTWMRITAAPNQKMTNLLDFRHELSEIRDQNETLVFNIAVTDDKEQGWQEIGHIDLTEDVISDSCDHRLHFAHPKSR